MTDKDRLNFLEQLVEERYCPGLIYDDFGHWAISLTGTQEITDEIPSDLVTTFFVEKCEWKGSLRDAIDSVMRELND